MTLHFFCFFFFNFYLFLYFLAMLGLRCCAGFSLVVWDRGYSLAVSREQLLLRWGLLLLEAQALGHSGFSSLGSRALEYRLNTCGTQT